MGCSPWGHKELGMPERPTLTCLLTSLVVSRGFSSLRIMGFSLHWFLLWNTGSQLPSFRGCTRRLGGPNAWA